VYIIKDGVKRTVDLPFQIGLSSDEAEAIITQLGHAVEEGGWWIITELHPPMKIDPALDQAAPLAWTDPGVQNVGVHTARDASIDKDVKAFVENGYAAQEQEQEQEQKQEDLNDYHWVGSDAAAASPEVTAP
jgi:hypothetical protein